MDLPFPFHFLGRVILGFFAEQLRRRATFESFVDDSEGPFDRWLQTKRTYGGTAYVLLIALSIYAFRLLKLFMFLACGNFTFSV